MAKEITSEPSQEIRLTMAWQRFIWYCQNRMAHGRITFDAANGQPIELIDEKPKVRFDRPDFFQGLTFEIVEPK